MYDYDVIIVGGGLAGLTAAIHLAQKKHSVLVFEKKPYPHHKVCGEYVSNEVVPYLEKMGVPLRNSGVVHINQFQISTVSGKSTTTQLPLGGVGVSRYHFDHLLYENALKIGVHFDFITAKKIEYQDDHFKVVTTEIKSYTSTILIGAYGKRSTLDKQLNRDFTKQKSGWLGVKAHYKFDVFPQHQVALHSFNGGYGGLSKTETGAVNFCYLASYQSFKKERDVTAFNENVVAKNPFLNDFFQRATPLFKEPLTIAQISFEKKKAVENHIIMCGDTAGLIHPLCGNGMAMAIHSAKIASEHVHQYLSSKAYTRAQMEQDYTKAWQHHFKQRLWMGRQLQSLLLNEKRANIALTAVTKSSLLLKKLIQKTHGKPIVC